jgi:predicted RecB family nuclease
MRFYDNALLHAPSDLNAFLGCAHAAALNLQKLRDPQSLPDKAADDETMVLIQDTGHTHEENYLAKLRESGNIVEVSSDGELGARAQATAKAMRDGAPAIYQAAFLDLPWHGFADFLRRVDMPSNLGNFSYETVDTKLARTPSPKHVLQLGLYPHELGARRAQQLQPTGPIEVASEG